MKTAILFLAAASAVLPTHSLAARIQDARQVMGIDLNACRPPAWPAAALAQQRTRSSTTTEVRIGEAGVVTEARVLASSGRADLDEAALAAVRTCVFHAVFATGQAPTSWLKTQYVWVPGEAGNAQAQDTLHDRQQLDSTRTLAAAGDPGAQNRLGAWYERGIHVKVDLVEAAAWYRLAADSGNAVAQNNLGVLYNRGAGVPHDPRQAVHWYAKAAEQGHGWAQANLAWAYQYGTAVAPDIDQALHWLTRSAEGGLAAAQVRLGLLLMHRAASDEERSAAMAWMARAAGQNDPQGVYYLGRSFELGLGNARDDAQAAALYRRVLERSGGRAETALGLLIEAGRASAVDEGEAARLYRKATQWRYPAAFYHDGRMLEQRGDDAVAAIVFRRGAELGDCDATVKHVQILQAKQTGAATDPQTADWARRARTCLARPASPPRLDSPATRF